jgi:hypothetical protein
MRIGPLFAFALHCAGLAAAVTLATAAHAANTTCINGRCFSCEGVMVCTNSQCLCNGAPIEGSGAPARQGPCGDAEVAPHPNGGGAVATSASVDPAAYVSADSAVCGTAAVSGPARLTGSSLNGSSRVSGRSVIEASSINGAARVSDSSIIRSSLNGSGQVTRSQVTNSTVNGAPRIEDSNVANSVINGNAAVVGRTVSDAVLNN